ncbi:hypothetical protein BCF33_0066 [Hasllibacter halocynthiae]|uniref:VCBS repeat protein n=1 Tax=Hasllibacter halocynthiae TaxID=595589 RepID=A0A2T0X6C0_9RHOB|nr:VCBS repeat-containing protein [Hasllibacter halocynthiae]PRY94476.1 hypothetical protein BCF33_0066 [Hasllibacter halocynthiae]
MALAAAGPAAAQDVAEARGTGGGCITTRPVGPVVRAPGSGIAAAFYWDPTTAYPHGALGDEVEGRMLLVRPEGRGFCDTVPARDGGVFEDTAPRIADVTGDGRAEVVAVSAHPALGARLEVWGYPLGPGEGPSHDLALVAATAPIGTRFRWLAVAGIVDLDGDGRVEIAFVDRPHLARTLRVVRLEGSRLREVAALEGVTNHRFGAPDISGGIRDCGTGPEVVLASGDWSRLLAVRLVGGALLARDLGPWSREAADAASACTG